MSPTHPAHIQTLDAIDRKHLAAYQEFSVLSADIKASQNVTNYAKHLYRTAWDFGDFEDKDENTVVAAYLYIACHQMRVGHTCQKVFAISTATMVDLMRNLR